MFIPYVCGNVVSWIINMLQCVCILVFKLPTFSVTTLWIPTSFFSLDANIIKKHLPVSWQFSTESLNSANYSDMIYECCTCIMLTRDYTSDDHNVSTFVTPDTHLVNVHAQYIYKEYNTVLDLSTVHLQDNILSVTECFQYGNYSCLVPIDQLAPSGTMSVALIVFHPVYSTSEPEFSKDTSIFGRRFGVLFLANDSKLYDRPISSLELLL